MSTNLKIRPASRDEFATAIEWAAAEGWNPGLDDLEVFHKADPRGFLMGWIDDKPVSSISVVRYGEEFGFLGFYIVRPEHRGTGVGIATWNAGLEHLAGRTIALDGVVDQQANYKKSGFRFVGRNVRYSARSFPDVEPPAGITIRHIQPDDASAIHQIDMHCFAAPRNAFVHEWCAVGKSHSRKTYVAEMAGKIAGFGTIRKCRQGYKIGPLFCFKPNIAAALLVKLFSVNTQNEEVFLDVPASNTAAISLVENAGFEPVFETARMVRGVPPSIAWKAVYGITSFELG